MEKLLIDALIALCQRYDLLPTSELAETLSELTGLDSEIIDEIID